MGGSTALFDAHCHLDWFADPVGVAADAAREGLSLLAVTVTPGGYRRAAALLGDSPAAHVAAGLHPWWLADGRCGERDVDELCDIVSRTRLVGEVGLDLSPRRCPDDATRDLQLRAFGRVCAAAAGASRPEAPHVISVHAVRAGTEALDVLERTGAAERCRCVLHWFSGTSDELHRARDLGCWVSLGERALATRRGREYARTYPAGRLLVETDLPPEEGSALGAQDVAASLGRAVEAIAAARGMGSQEASEVLLEGARGLLLG